MSVNRITAKVISRFH